MSAIPYHPLADIFPLLEGAEFAELVGAVKANGLRRPIILLDGMILDGRNRYRACVAADVPGRFEPFTGRDPIAFVIDENIHRRNLNESQRAAAAAELARMAQGARTDLSPIGEKSQADRAALVGASKRSVERADYVKERGEPELFAAVKRGKLAVAAAAQAAKFAPEMQRKIAEQAESGKENVVRTVIKQEARAVRETELGAKQQALPQKKYGVILADPEWRFKPWSEATGMDRAADNHYLTSATDVIAARDVPSIAADDCVLVLWGVAPMLLDALQVMTAWGFAYKTHAIWHKLRSGDGRGMGYWFTGEHELILIGVRGKVVAPATALCGSIIAAPWQGRHSAKPEIVAELIERAFPTLPKIELNRRGPARPGWDAWGNESEQSPESILPTVDSPTPRVDAEPAPVSQNHTDAGSIHTIGEFTADYTLPTKEELAVDPYEIPGFLRRA